MAMTGMTLANDISVNVREACRFLADYGERLFSSGSTCIRLEKNLRRMACAWGLEVEMSILPHHIHLTVHTPDRSDSDTAVATIRPRPVNFAVITSLSSMSWAIADGKMTLEQAREEMGAMPQSMAQLGCWWETLLVSTANASFCRLFGGDVTAMTIVFIATLAGYTTKQFMMEKGVDVRVIFVVCSFISAVLASADSLFSLGTTPQIALGTSILYLVPGIPFLNSFSDMIDGHYICAFGRLMNAIVLTACLSVGLCAGMMLMDIGMF